MTLISRMSRLFRADIHHLLDCMEEPEIVLKQAIREMEDEISRDDEEKNRIESLKLRLQSEHEELQVEIEAMQNNIRSAFGVEDELLAKSFVKRKLIAERRIERIKRDAAKLEKSREEFERKITERRKKLQEIQEHARLYKKAHPQEKKSWSNNPVQTQSEISQEEIELAYLEAKKAHEQLSL